MYAYIYICIYICIHMKTFCPAQPHYNGPKYIFVYIYIYIYIFICIYICTCTYICIYIHMCSDCQAQPHCTRPSGHKSTETAATLVYMRSYTNMYVHNYTYIFVHTHVYLLFAQRNHPVPDHMKKNRRK